MANYTALDVKNLREATGAGMMDCKKALDETDGDFNAAVELLRVKGAKDVNKREGRVASSGLVAGIVEGDSKGALVEVNCETDFVAKTPDFIALGDKVAKHILDSNPADVAALLSSELEAGKTVQQALDEANAVMGEKVEIKKFSRLDGGYVHVYLHKPDPALPAGVGSIVQLDVANEQVAKDLAQQVAAMAPLYLTREEVPADVIDTEKRVAEQTAKEEGKPEAAISKIVEGRVGSYFKDFCLVEQAWVRDNKKTIKNLLEENKVNVKGFARYKVGQA
jgi:elongation factor Ts